jgi:hypothetical protein
MTQHYKHYKSCRVLSCAHQHLTLEYTLKNPNDFSAVMADINRGVASYENLHNHRLNVNSAGVPNTTRTVTFKGLLPTRPLSGSAIKDLSHALAGEGALDSFERGAVEDRVNQLPDPPPRRSAAGRY